MPAVHVPAVSVQPLPANFTKMFKPGIIGGHDGALTVTKTGAAAAALIAFVAVRLMVYWPLCEKAGVKVALLLEGAE